MEVTYKNTPNDLFQTYWYRQFRSRGFYISTALMFAFLGIVGWNLTELIGQSVLSRILILLAYLAACFVILGLGLSLVMKIAFSSQKTRSMMKPITLRIEENGLAAQISLEPNSYAWDEIEDIQQSKRFIFLYIDRYRQYSIPKRAFVSPQAAEDFYQTAYDLWEAAKK